MRYDYPRMLAEHENVRLLWPALTRIQSMRFAVTKKKSQGLAHEIWRGGASLSAAERR